ncbi:TPA: hypothetical protein SG275_001465 [Campylobacter coli]|nr:hypothetical protein [Campylobacter coli]
MLSNEEIKYFQTHKNEITDELLETIRAQGKLGKAQALEILDLPKDSDNYYLDAYGTRISYNGSRGLKKAYTKLNLSPIHISELEKCANDPLYFLRNYVRMTTPKGFDFVDSRPYQDEFIQLLSDDSIENVISMQPRQCVEANTKINVNGNETTIVELFNNQESNKRLYFNSSKFIESYECKDKYVETPVGKVKILEVHKTIKYNIFEIETENGFKLQASELHVLIDENDNELYVKDCLNKVIKTKSGLSKIISKSFIKYDHCYDLTLEHYHLYYTNGVLSHNSSKSTTTSVKLAHLYCFKKDLNIGIVAYSGNSAREFLDKTKKILIGLPIWMQPGTVTWNKGSIECENNIKILTDVPSSDAFRGTSTNIIVVDECLEYDTIINVYSETLNESFDIKIGDFYNLVDLRSNIINEFTNFAKPTNSVLLEKYVDFCLFKQTNKIKGSTESHHILPKNIDCFPQYSKSIWNIVNLSFKDHFIAHSILAECYPDINKILLAWYMMANKNSKTKVRNLNKVIDANTYEKLKKESIKKISYINSQIVSVKKNGKWLKVSKEEYHNNKKIYETPGLNKIYCENITTGEKMWLDKVDYDPKIYKTHNSNMCVMVNVITKQVERISKGARTADHMGLNKFIVVCRNGIHITIQAKYIENNDIYITDCKQMIKNIKLLNVLIRKQCKIQKKCEKGVGMVTCFDVQQKTFKRIPKKIFDADRDRYLGTTNKKIKEYI